MCSLRHNHCYQFSGLQRVPNHALAVYILSALALSQTPSGLVFGCFSLPGFLQLSQSSPPPPLPSSSSSSCRGQNNIDLLLTMTDERWTKTFHYERERQSIGIQLRPPCNAAVCSLCAAPPPWAQWLIGKSTYM